MSEHESIIAIQHHLPQEITIFHLYSHQDKIKGNANLMFPEKLNDLSDSVADKYARSQINNPIPFTPLAIYFDNAYLLNNYQYYLRRLCFQQDANEYVKSKYNWSVRTSIDIDWKSHIEIINKPSNHSYQVKVNFVHYLLSSGKNNCLIKHICPFYKIQEHSDTHHDHFLICPDSDRNKTIWIAKLTTRLSLLGTQKTIITIIVREMKSFYYNSIKNPISTLSPTLTSIQ